MTLPETLIEKMKSDMQGLDSKELVQVREHLFIAERLLKRSLYEFGSELRNEIEVFLGEEPLLTHLQPKRY